MKILITAGGTTEQIDSVRSITNTSTGRLGSLMAEAFDKFEDTDKIYYVCGKNTIKPQSDKTEIICIDTVASLETAIRKLLDEESIDIIIHCMAVSDYRVKTVTSQTLLEDSLKAKLNTLSTDKKQITDSFIHSIFENIETLKKNDDKISSDIDNLILFMERTPKIISLFQTLAPKSILVGFKLLNHVPLETLIDTAYHILQDNKCSFVLANDLRDITANSHVGFLVDREKNLKRYSTKAEIAAGIAAETTRIKRKIL